MNTETPQALGYSMPAEWEKHDAVWLSWPHDTDSFPYLPEAEEAYVNILKALEGCEPVNLLVRDLGMEAYVRELLCDDQVKTATHFWVIDYADVWFRDYGPIFVKNARARSLAAVKWIYNAYGKYPELLKDNHVPYFLNKILQMKMFEPGMVLEGGSFDVNGSGTLLTTEQCLLNKNRNPHLSKQQIERHLQDFLGVKKIIWLKQGILGDDTDGHVDDVARFVNATTVFCAYEENPKDENFSVLKENYEILLHSEDQDGSPLRVVKLPIPKTISHDGKRLAVSYTNFYIANAKVLMPTFRHPYDAEAIRIIQEYFPDRKVVGIDCSSLIYGGGTIHCATQQQPSLE